MCEPTTVMLAMSAASMALTTAAASKQARAQKQAAKAQADLQNRAADQAKARGVEQEQQARLETSELISRQRVGLASTGVDLQSGSALDTVLDTVEQGERRALNIRADNALEVNNIRSGAAFSTARANNISPGAATLTAGIAGASQFADRWTTASANRKKVQATGDANFPGNT